MGAEMMDARERLERMTDEACEMFDACIVPKEIQAALRELAKDHRDPDGWHTPCELGSKVLAITELEL